MIELIIATTNAGKLREIRELLKDLDVKITSLSDYPDAPKVEEDGKNFAQNALKKAATIALYTGKLTLGEDSGLEVKALGNVEAISSVDVKSQVVHGQPIPFGYLALTTAYGCGYVAVLVIAASLVFSRRDFK